MKQALFLLLTWFTINLSKLDEPVIKVTRTSTDAQIKQSQQQALQQYGVKAEFQLVERNSKGEITNLKFVRYNKAGQEGGSCASDNFGALVITRDGCKIADLGHENEI